MSVIQASNGMAYESTDDSLKALFDDQFSVDRIIEASHLDFTTTCTHSCTCTFIC